MDKRYQIFISSTFVDLKEERQAVLRAILELNHMPAGMELFPASDEAAWQLIRDVIDGSDYYILIIGGRYGSLDETGLGFTEKEYDYAVDAKKPVIPLLHQNPDNLPREKTDTDPQAWDKLKLFRAKVETRHTCVYWNNAEELKAKVIIGLTTAGKRYPAIGWVRADELPDRDATLELLRLRKKVEDLETELSRARVTAPKESEHLAQGDDTQKFRFEFHFRDKGEFRSYNRKGSGSFRSTWNAIFYSLAPLMINEASENELKTALDDFVESQVVGGLLKEDKFSDKTLEDFVILDEDFQTIKVQLRALGFVTKSDRQRSVRDTSSYWTLTPYGDEVMTRLRAIRRDDASSTSLEAK